MRQPQALTANFNSMQHMHTTHLIMDRLKVASAAVRERDRLGPRTSQRGSEMSPRVWFLKSRPGYEGVRFHNRDRDGRSRVQSRLVRNRHRDPRNSTEPSPTLYLHPGMISRDFVGVRPSFQRSGHLFALGSSSSHFTHGTAVLPSSTDASYCSKAFRFAARTFQLLRHNSRQDVKSRGKRRSISIGHVVSRCRNTLRANPEQSLASTWFTPGRRLDKLYSHASPVKFISATATVWGLSSSLQPSPFLPSGTSAAEKYADRTHAVRLCRKSLCTTGSCQRASEMYQGGGAAAEATISRHGP
ncbi:uncharacterized protein CLUP02_04311 [Colletotrichum lupini]|uniref:Uncharacterized protein n=1 Tax=Colletotrichum lupini TaxID=145971 RepID=A0A9Q8WD01_9PEZI|nr:uncharacterized protein CLUP02_04311 [Colletotrichum lupini]UQC78834.1 hypothetical protein CLUP02_04311 [Colletotrichum lupini]